MAADRLDYFAACSLGLEPALAGELRELEAADIEERRGGVAFRGDQRLGYAANLWLRSAVRVQDELCSFEARNPDELYAAVAGIDWARYLTPEQTLAVFATVRNSEIGDPRFCALRVKDAVVDQQRERGGVRSSIDTRAPDLPLKLVVLGTQARLYRDWSGDSLHKRGWRPVQVKSPLNEATAAGLILLSDWDRRSPVADPMCGSGTFCIEAAMLAANRAPGLGRSFAFERWIDCDLATWTQLRSAARAAALDELPFAITGGDHHPGALSVAGASARAAGVAGMIRFHRSDARDLELPGPPSVVFVNPPYGERLHGDDRAQLEEAWRSLGNFLHQRCAGATAWVLSGNKELTRLLGLRTSRRIPVRNGPIECRWLRYEVRER